MPDLMSILWIASPLLNTAILLFMARKRLYQQYPAFLSYLILSILGFLVLYPVRKLGTSADYFYAYWTFGGLTSACCVAIVCELLSVMLRPFLGLRDAGKLLFRWAAVIMIVMALVIAFSSNVQGSYLVAGVLELERSTRLMQIGLLLLVLCCSRYLGISASNRAYGLTLGLGLNSGAGFILLSMSAHLGTRFAQPMSLGMSAAYNLSAILWLAYVIKPERRRDIRPLPISSPLVRWNEIASAMGHGANVAYMPHPGTYEIEKIAHRQ